MRGLIKRATLAVSVMVVVVAPMLAQQVFGDPTPSYTYYQLPTSSAYPTGLTQGADGAMWFVENAVDKIGRISSTGQISEYPIGIATSGVQSITQGPDGAMWFTETLANKIGRITPDGTVTQFNLITDSALPYAITAGPDGALWFTEFNAYKIARITTDGQITEYPANGIPYWMTTNPASGLWSTDNIASKIHHFLPTGENDLTYAATQYSDPLKITTGPNGAMWFTEGFSSGNPAAGNKVATLTTDGTINEYPMPIDNGMPSSITSGPENALWTTWNGNLSANRVYKVDTDGTMTDFTAGQSFGYLTSIAADNSGHLWVSDRDHNAIIKMNPNTTLPSSDAANLTLSPQASIDNVGGLASFTATATNKLGSPIVGATVRFTVFGSDNLFASCTTDTRGVCSYAYTGPNLPGADSISAYVDTNENQSLDMTEPVASASEVWVLPQITPGQVAGGGHIPAIDGQQNVAFGFTAKSSPGGANGNCQLIDQSANINIHCDSVSSMAVYGDTASVYGLASVNQTQSVSYRLDITDNGNAANTDTFSMHTSSGYTVSGTLLDGNVHIGH